MTTFRMYLQLVKATALSLTLLSAVFVSQSLSEIFPNVGGGVAELNALGGGTSSILRPESLDLSTQTVKITNDSSFAFGGDLQLQDAGKFANGTARPKMITVQISKDKPGEIFSTPMELESLRKVEVVFGQALQEYIRLEEEKLTLLKKLAAEYRAKDPHRSASSHTDNPLRVFKTIKRLSAEREYTESVMKLNAADAIIHNAIKVDLFMRRIPNNDDMKAAAQGMLRLQRIYLLNATDMAMGKIRPNSQPVEELTASDCFELGRSSFEIGDYRRAMEWFEESRKRVHEDQAFPIEEAVVLQFLAHSLHRQGNTARAWNLTKQLLTLTPESSSAQGDLEFYEKEMKDKDIDVPLTDGDIPPLVLAPEHIDEDQRYHHLYKRLCRGETTRDPTIDSTNLCYYQRNKPFLRLAPLKVERISTEPEVLIFRQAVSDFEVTVMKKLAIPKLHRSMVLDKEMIQKSRTSQSAWLFNEDHEIVESIDRRVEDMTGLTTKTAEAFQIAKYGLGGHYAPHFDISADNETHGSDPIGGKRIATLLLLLGKPIAGGATTFPNLNLSVFADQNDALLWYNMLRNGSRAEYSLHAGCPVLIGTKWISNKWLHERGQEFRRQCDTNPSL